MRTPYRGDVTGGLAGYTPAYCWGMEWMVIAALVAALALIVGSALHIALTWANRKGWVYYRNEHRPPPRTLGLLEEIYQPSIEHVIEEETSEQTRADQAVSGAPDTAGSND